MWEHILIGQPYRTVGRGDTAPPPQPALDVAYGSRWNFARRTRKHTGSGLGFYRDQLDLLRPNQFLWDPYPAEAYAAVPEHSRIHSGAWRASVPLICFDIVEVHLPERVMRQYGLVQGIPPPCDTEPQLHLISRRNQAGANWMEINRRHIARRDHRLELLAQGAPIDVVGAPTTPDYMPWFLSITRRWMTPRAILETAHYAPAAPTMTQFTQGAADVMRYSQEEPVREIAHGMLFGSQFQHFIPEVAAQHSPTTSHTHMACSPSYDYHLEEMDHSYPVDAAGTSQAVPSRPSQYQSPPLPERHANASFYRRRRRRPTQLDKVDEGS
ncbi:serine/threonine-protein phosphatase 7 long form homolog [Amaranthus tricolor]|uniref:serine/threonine-protein phosphatase 7 long form homolog n=1 Tax=Amaranthus tricolor TaxID=29722 RepID=UPI0025902CCE|nr:serine/threonine-protein phosphatase 7 long form homolog [Amaranthus tricolor]